MRKVWEWMAALAGVFVVFVVVPFVILAALALFNDRIYGDWTCMFARCRKVQVIK